MNLDGILYSSLKVSQTTVIYQNSRLPAIAFILSDNTTKQLFDDIGWIIVKAVDEEKYNDVSSINPVMGYRTGEGFKWFADWNLPTTHGVYKVVGFATDKV
ncbi:unnamed protein product [Diatraea saccharalis]|uniref:Uncharacterized protein n=1 Tax=Diatraea saccharalis TaxID=40085 RepID=A0A9N9R5K4_9NEOP|nr:unnamed protein product [Diatraea saccharalis]